MAIKSGVLGKLKNFNSIRQKQVTLPVAKIRAIVNPLTVRDDLSLRTMIVSPDVYDRLLSEVIYRHTEFLDMVLPDGNIFKFDQKPTLEQFQDMVSEFDKKSLLWGIYASTYETFGKQEVKCPSCQDKWEDLVNADQVIPPGTFMIWDEEKSFKDFIFPIDIPVEGNSEISMFRFNTYVPTIKDHLGVLRLVSGDKMKENYDKFNKILSTSEELTLITKSIEVFSVVVTELKTEESDPKLKTEEPKQQELEIVQGLLDVYQTINDYIPLNIVDEVGKKYDEKFKVYIPSFKKPIECMNCGNSFNFSVEIETALFKSFFKIK